MKSDLTTRGARGSQVTMEKALGVHGQPSAIRFFLVCTSGHPPTNRLRKSERLDTNGDNSVLHGELPRHLMGSVENCSV